MSRKNPFIQPALGAIGLLGLAVASPSAHATTLASLTVEQMTDASTYIVRGTVTDTWTDLDSSGHVWSHARLAVSHTFKGPDEPTTLVVDQPGGTYGDTTTNTWSAAQFSVDEEVLIFLDDILDGTHWAPVGMFEGKYTIRRAPHEMREDLTRWQGSPTVHYDARFLPHPSTILYYDDMVAKIRDHLKVGWDGTKIPGLNVEKLERINAPERRVHP